MSNRLGLIPVADLSDQQRSFHDSVSKDIDKRKHEIPYRVTLDNGTLLGPWGILMHHPAVGSNFLGLARSIRGIAGLSPYGREVVIAVVGAHLKAETIIYSHSFHAREAGITDSELRDITSGICPTTLKDEGRIAFELATALGKGGVVDVALWEKAVNLLGKDGATAIMHYTALYTYVGIMFNALDARIPQESTQHKAC